jgi:SNF2 family DNA or RNA helicase
VLLTSILRLHPTDRVVVVSGQLAILDAVQDLVITKNGWSACRLDGTVSVDQRQCIVDYFNQTSCSDYVCLLSTRAGGVGINL